MWFDSHCHLHLCESARPDQLINAAVAAGVSEMVTVGIDSGSNALALELASHEAVYAAVGVHPNSADEWDDAAKAALIALLDDDRVVAVGETGLDFYRDNVTPEVQALAFQDHIALAKRFDKALIIHTRDSLDAALEVLESQGPPARFVFHCWAGDEQQMDRALELGAYVSFAGNVSFKSAQNLRDAAARAPLDRLLVETDSPYLTPVPHRGRPNEPGHVPLVGEAIAMARATNVEAIQRATRVNAHRLFGVG